MIALTHFSSTATRTSRPAPSRRWPRWPARRVPARAAGPLDRRPDGVGAAHRVGEHRLLPPGARRYEVKLHATPLLAEALDVPGGFESLVDVAPGGESVARRATGNPGA